MNNKHGFRFDRDEITQYITALYELNDLVMYALAEGNDPRIHDEKTRRVRFYFECLADSLWKTGVFKSQQEARNFIRADTDALQNAGGPGGLCPDDGLLDPSEIAEGLVALRDLNEFLFQAPICLLSSGLSDDCTADAGGMNICFTRSYNDLTLVKMHPKLQADKNAENCLWIEGSIKAHRYDVVRPAVDRLLLSIMGIMEVIGLLQYKSWLPSHPTQHVSIGTKDRVNSGAYVDMRSVRLYPHLTGLYSAQPENEIDSATTIQSRLVYNLLALNRAINDRSPSALAVQHACRMYLRSYEA